MHCNNYRFMFKMSLPIRQRLAVYNFFVYCIIFELISKYISIHWSLIIKNTFGLYTSGPNCPLNAAVL